MKKYNPLVIDKSSPTFVNDEGVKWWAIDMGKEEYGQAYYVEKSDGERQYVVVKDHEIIYVETNTLESLAWWFTTQELLVTHGN